MYHVHHDPPIYDLDLKVELFSVGTITKYTYKFIFKIVLHEGHKYEYIRWPLVWKELQFQFY